MHDSSMKLMSFFRDEYLTSMQGCSILDVGSRLAGGQTICYRELFEPTFSYSGMDIVAGRNVDIVGYDNIKQIYDVVISGQVMEHVRRPWDWLKNLKQYFKRYICIIAPNTHREHRHPLDTYRYFPDGMRDLFDYAGIREVEIFKRKKDTIGIGEK